MLTYYFVSSVFKSTKQIQIQNISLKVSKSKFELKKKLIYSIKGSSKS